VPTVRFTAIEKALVPPAQDQPVRENSPDRSAIATKKNREGRWGRVMGESNSSARPNPGGGFYGPPTSIVGLHKP